jgi:serine/threonine protein kinase
MLSQEADRMRQRSLERMSEGGQLDVDGLIEEAERASMDEGLSPDAGAAGGKQQPGAGAGAPSSSSSSSSSQQPKSTGPGSSWEDEGEDEEDGEGQPPPPLIPAVPLSSRPPSSATGSGRGGGSSVSGGSVTGALSLAEGEALADIGDGRVTPGDFEIYRVLGSLSVQQVYEVDDSTSLLGRKREVVGGVTMGTPGSRGPSVLAYLGQYISGQPFEGPVTTLVREYLPSARSVAINEMRIMRELVGNFPERTWATAQQDVKEGPPVCRVLGYFVGNSSDEAVKALTAAGVDISPYLPQMESLYLAYPFANLRPCSLHATYRQPEPSKWFNGIEKAARGRRNWLRAFARGGLSALSFCHARGVAHGALSSSSLLCSTLEDREYDKLAVKLDNFGFARRLQGGRLDPSLPVEDSPLASALRADRQALALALLETVFSALQTRQWGREGTNPFPAAMASDEDGGWSDAAPPPSSSKPSKATADNFERLLGDVFKYDVAEFRAYCVSEPSWAEAVAFMDQGGPAGDASAAAGGASSSAPSAAASPLANLKLPSLPFIGGGGGGSNQQQQQPPPAAASTEESSPPAAGGSLPEGSGWSLLRALLDVHSPLDTVVRRHEGFLQFRV